MLTKRITTNTWTSSLILSAHTEPVRLAPRGVSWAGRAAMAGLMISCLAAAASAATITVPPGLNPGDTYRLVFVTSTTTSGTSGSIEYYDQFVSAVAGSSAPLAALGTSWQAIVSTSSVTAFSHLGGAFSTPVYRLDGLLVANDSSDLWDLSLARPIELDELARPLYRNGIPDNLGVEVWTGTRYNGNIDLNWAMGGVFPIYGHSGSAADQWLDAGRTFSTDQSHLYAISGVITVEQAAIPEPGTAGLLIVSLSALCLQMARKCLSGGRSSR